MTWSKPIMFQMLARSQLVRCAFASFLRQKHAQVAKTKTGLKLALLIVALELNVFIIALDQTIIAPATPVISCVSCPFIAVNSANLLQQSIQCPARYWMVHFSLSYDHDCSPTILRSFVWHLPRQMGFPLDHLRVRNWLSCLRHSTELECFHCGSCCCRHWACRWLRWDYDYNFAFCTIGQDSSLHLVDWSCVRGWCSSRSHYWRCFDDGSDMALVNAC
jgi:hypothetical protein